MEPDRLLYSEVRALKEGHSIQEIVRALARFEAGHDLTEKDQNALDYAQTFLENVLHGYSWLDDPNVNAQSKDYAHSFVAAVRSHVPRLTVAHFKDDISSMLTNVRDLRAGKDLDTGKLGQARRLFSTLLSDTLDYLDTLHAPSRPETVMQWTPSST